jgi:hypothetical protein
MGYVFDIRVYECPACHNVLTLEKLYQQQVMYTFGQATTSKYSQAKPMTPNTSVRVWWDQSVSAYRMTSAFNAALVDALKRFIPASDRSFDPATKIWTFVERQLTPLQSLFTTLNIKPTIVTRAQCEAQQAQSHQAASASASAGNVNVTSQRASLDAVMIQFVQLLPYDAARFAYRKAIAEMHPDAGGNAADASTLNVVWSRLEKDVYGK